MLCLSVVSACGGRDLRRQEELPNWIVVTGNLAALLVEEQLLYMHICTHGVSFWLSDVKICSRASELVGFFYFAVRFGFSYLNG